MSYTLAAGSALRGVYNRSLAAAINYQNPGTEGCADTAPFTPGFIDNDLFGAYGGCQYSHKLTSNHSRQ